MNKNPPSQDNNPEIKFPHANISAARALADIVRKTLGPQTHDVMLLNKLESHIEGDPFSPVDDDIIVTNDGATILENLPLEHPVVPVLSRLAGPEQPGDSDVEGEQITDGISTAITLTESLLIEAESLIDEGVHPRDVQLGYQLAKQTAVKQLKHWSSLSQEPEERRQQLLSVARTAMTGNDVGGNLDQWAKYIVEASRLVGSPTPEGFAVRQISDGSLDDSRLVQGAVLDRSEPAHMEMPTRIKDATVAIFGGTKEGGLRQHEIPNNWTATSDSISDVEKFNEYEQDYREQVVDKLCSYGVDVVVAKQGIDTEYQQLLANNDILGIRGVTQLDLNQVSLATGGTAVLKTDDFSAADLGHAGVISVEQIEPRENRRTNRQMIVFDDCQNPDAVTMLLHGMTSNTGQQASTSLRKALAATAAAKGLGDHPAGIVPGGANPEIRIVEELREFALTRDDRVQLAIEGYANAVERVTKILLENAGLDPLAKIPTLKASIINGGESHGISLPSGQVASMQSEGILDALSHRLWVYEAATDVSSQVITIDDAIDAEFTNEKVDEGDAIYDEVSERHAEHQEARK